MNKKQKKIDLVAEKQADKAVIITMIFLLGGIITAFFHVGLTVVLIGISILAVIKMAYWHLIIFLNKRLPK